MADYAQWFESPGICNGCGKLATGVLRSDQNEKLGPYCERCANKRIKAAHKKGQFLPDARIAYNEILVKATRP